MLTCVVLEKQTRNIDLMEDPFSEGAEDNRVYKREEQQRGKTIYIPRGRLKSVMLPTLCFADTLPVATPHFYCSRFTGDGCEAGHPSPRLSPHGVLSLSQTSVKRCGSHAYRSVGGSQVPDTKHGTRGVCKLRKHLLYGLEGLQRCIRLYMSAAILSYQPTSAVTPQSKYWQTT